MKEEISQDFEEQPRKQYGSSMPWTGNRWNSSVTVQSKLHCHGLRDCQLRNKPLFQKFTLSSLKEPAKRLLEKSLSFTPPNRYVWRSKVEALKPKNNVPLLKHSGGSIVLWAYFTACGSGTLRKLDGILKKDKYLQIFPFQPVITGTQLGVPTPFWLRRHLLRTKY